MIHSDVWGISPIISHANYKYFVTFIDDYSKYTWIYFLRSKSEVFSVFKTFVAYIETQFSSNIKVLRSDSGGEYMSSEFHDFLQQKGIVSNVLVLIHLSKMVLLNVRTVIYWMLLEPYYLNLLFHLNSGSKP